RAPFEGQRKASLYTFRFYGVTEVPTVSPFLTGPFGPFSRDAFCTPWRREGDSNPRRLAPQRFSRPSHSSALPSLQTPDQQRYHHNRPRRARILIVASVGTGGNPHSSIECGDHRARIECRNVGDGCGTG